MKIFANEEPIQILWNLTKDLYFNEGIEIFKESMHEEVEDVPNSYILLRSQLSDSPEKFGDGKSILRSSDCDIILVSKGYAEDSTDLHNINKKKIRELLKNQNISFQEFNLGYDDNLKSTQHTFRIEVEYIG